MKEGRERQAKGRNEGGDERGVRGANLEEGRGTFCRAELGMEGVRVKGNEKKK